jgi:lysine 2,3-aminomutase
VDHLQGKIGGLGIPVYAVDTGAEGKIPLNPQTVMGRETGKWILRNHRGEKVVYPDPPWNPAAGTESK